MPGGASTELQTITTATEFGSPASVFVGMPLGGTFSPRHRPRCRALLCRGELLANLAEAIPDWVWRGSGSVTISRSRPSPITP